MTKHNNQPPLKVIFLDIDGVLNTARAHIAYESSKWDPVGVAILGRVCEETGAKLVISSVWRGSMERWIHAHQLLDAVGLGKYGICSQHVGVDYDRSNEFHRTSPGHDNPRGERIKHWVDEWNPDNYAILDDDGDMLSSQSRHFVKVNGFDGITFSTYQRLIKILGKSEDGNSLQEANFDGNSDATDENENSVWKASFNVELTGITAMTTDHAIEIARERLIERLMAEDFKVDPTVSVMSHEEVDVMDDPSTFGDTMIKS